MEANRAYERGIKFSKNFLPILKTVIGRPGDLRPLISKESVHPETLKLSINTEPIVTSLSGLQPLTLKLVSQSSLETFWDQLVSQFHYLGYRNLLGHRLKYLVFSKSRPVAALSWSAPALKLRARDCFIGWSDKQRKKYLNRVANNSRFLILPWVKVTNLASHVLSLNTRLLKKDWQQHFNTTLLLLETFVDPHCFKATSYKAANWHFLLAIPMGTVNWAKDTCTTVWPRRSMYMS